MTCLLVLYSNDCLIVKTIREHPARRLTNGGRSLKYYVGQGRRTLGGRCHFTLFIVDLFRFLVAQQ